MMKVLVDGEPIGETAGGMVRLAAKMGRELPARYLAVDFSSPDEGTWFVPEKVDVIAAAPDGRSYRVARWLPAHGPASLPSPFDLRLEIPWREAEEIRPSSAAFAGKRPAAGAPANALGAWIPGGPAKSAFGFRPEPKRGAPFTWAEKNENPRAFLPPGASGPHRAACWFDVSRIEIAIAPPGGEPYILSACILDYDRNGRAEEVTVSGEEGPLDARKADRSETAAGAWLSWKVTGPVTIDVRKLEGFNAVLSAVLIDPAP
jgi:hypothetical protein